MKYLLLLLLFCARFAFADAAVSCLQFGTTERAQSITNTCSDEVIVFWCHDSDKPDSFTRSGRCGTDGKYYQKQWVFKPGYTENNSYSLPPGAKISYGACFGGYGAYQTMDDNGGYLCKLPKTAADGEAIFTSTASAPNAGEACNRAQALARENKGIVGQCACQTRGSVNICRVQSTGPKPGFSVIGAAKKELRERTKCKPDEQDCKPSRKNVAIGGIR